MDISCFGGRCLEFLRNTISGRIHKCSPGPNQPWLTEAGIGSFWFSTRLSVPFREFISKMGIVKKNSSIIRGLQANPQVLCCSVSRIFNQLIHQSTISRASAVQKFLEKG